MWAVACVLGLVYIGSSFADAARQDLSNEASTLIFIFAAVGPAFAILALIVGVKFGPGTQAEAAAHRG